MNWAWATSLDSLWHSPAFPMWLTLAAAGFFAILVLVTLLRAEKSVANGALTVITLLAIGIAVAATLRGFGTAGRDVASEVSSAPSVSASLPALSCIDDLAGETVLTACEKVLFGSAEAAAAAVSYAAAQITRLIAAGNVATANATMTPELQSLRRAVERDRYGLMAYVLMVRDHCTPTECAAFRSLTESSQIAANINDRIYDGLIMRYSGSWNAPMPSVPPSAGPLAALPSSMPTGKPTNADFPTSASTPAVSIMTPEPARAAPTTGGPAPSHAASTTASAPAAPKKQPASKPARPLAAAPAPAPVPVPAPAASDD